jgi:hypothetical protein
MTPFSDLSPFEQNCINMARIERGLPAIGVTTGSSDTRTAVPSFMQSVIGQSPAVPSPGEEATFEIRIKNTSSSLKPAPPGTTPQPEPGSPRPGVEPRWTTPSEPQSSASFAAGVASERARAQFASRVRTSVARALQRRGQGSNDSYAVALLEAEKKREPRFVVEPAAALPQSQELTGEQRDFADRLCAKINRILRPEARRLRI